MNAEGMNREDVLAKVRGHLSAELEVPLAEIEESTRLREDLDADSLDLYELVMELEDTYGSASPKKRRPGSRRSARRSTSCPGDSAPRPDRPMARGIRRLGSRGRRAQRGPAELAELIDRLPGDLRRHAVTHSSWTDHRADSYGRLAFLGDGVLGVAVAEHLFRRFPRADIGRLTKVHGQAVSGRACMEVGEMLGLPEMLRGPRPPSSRAG